MFIFNYARFNAKAVLEALVQHRVTTLCAPPTVWRMLIQEPLGDYRVALREALSAGEPLNPEVIDRVQNAWGLTIRDGYGQTETTAQIGNSPGQAVKAGSMGGRFPATTSCCSIPTAACRRRRAKSVCASRTAARPDRRLRG